MFALKNILSLSSAIYFCTTVVMAQETQNNDSKDDKEVILSHKIRNSAITVTASGSENNLNNNGFAISIITNDEIKKLQTQDITTILERVPGVTTTRNGPIGGFTGVRIRGSEAEQVLVLVDGVRVNDPSSPGGGFDFGNLLSGGLSRIEILRGSNSIIWGSQAIGGVIDIQTSQGNDGFSINAEYGRDDSRTFNAALNQNVGSLNIGLSGGYFNNDGFSSFDGGTENDSFEQYYINGRTSLEITDQLTAKIGGRLANGRLNIDGFPAPMFTFADTNELQDTQEISAYGGLEYNIDALTLNANYSLLDNNRDNFDPTNLNSFDFSSRGRTERLTLRADIQINDIFALNLGAENEESNFNTGPLSTSEETGIDSLYGYLSSDLGSFNISGGIRLDDHEQFGTQVVFGANTSFTPRDNLFVKAAYNEGFKAPTLFQLLSNFGNTNLNPETSKSYELGIGLADRNSNYGVYWEVNAFQRDSENQIDFISCFGISDGICSARPFGTFDNILNTRSRGVEAQLGSQISERFSASAAYSYIDTENRSVGNANFGNQLARRPEHALTVSADWDGKIAKQSLNLGIDMRLVSDSFDDAANNISLDGYALFTLRASILIGQAFELYGRIENLFDEDYQTIANFGTPGRGGFIGVRARF